MPTVLSRPRKAGNEAVIRQASVARWTIDRLSGRRSDRADLAGVDSAKASFLAAMSHELRTPLNAIIGFAEIMEAEVLGPMPIAQYRDYVRDIIQSGRTLLQTIEDVLEISRAEAGELSLNKREVDLHRLIDEALGAVAGLCRARGIRVKAHVPDDTVVKVDPPKMHRLLGCLLSNAIKFSPDGGTIDVDARLSRHREVNIRIEDHGIGMNAVEIERAFEPFVQLEDKLSRRFEGSGLGLPLARLLAELHGGQVKLDSRPGIGTTATVRLPAYGAAGSD